MLATSGPRGIWAWPISVIGQLSIALVFGALAARIPISGYCALDPTLSLEDAVGKWKPRTVYEPRWSADRAQEYRTAWAQAANACAAEGEHS